MSTLVGIMVLTLVTILVVEFGNRVNAPWPALMVLVGVGIAWIPGQHLNVPNDLVLPLLLPPLLYTAAERTSWRMFRMRWRTIVIFAVGLTIFTTAMVSGTAWLLYAGMGLPAALVLGAMVSPPDPVAVEAVSKTVPLPRRILSTLQTEGLFNDAVALVIFEVALAALESGEEIQPRELLSDFLVGLVLAVIVGLVLATGVRLIVRLSDNAIASAAATVVLPYGAYLIADSIEASGVLAVVVAALEYRRTESPDDVEERLVRASFWEVAELILTGLAFGLIGEGFQDVLSEYGSQVWRMIGKGLIIALVVVVVRLVYLVVLTRVNRMRGTPIMAPRTWKEAIVMTWGGMRGLITLALAVSLPRFIGPGDEYFSERAQLIVASCMVLVVTLLIAGLTMPWLLRVLNVGSEAEVERKQERELAHGAARRAFDAIHEMEDLPDPVVERIDAVVEQLESGLLERTVVEDIDEDINTRRTNRAILYQVQKTALAAARESLIEARNQTGADPVVVDRVLQRLDLQTSLMRKRD